MTFNFSSSLQSLYNLILSENSNMKKFDNELRQLVKEILSTLECTPAVAILSLQMLVALMYTSGNNSQFHVYPGLNYTCCTFFQNGCVISIGSLTNYPPPFTIFSG